MGEMLESVLSQSFEDFEVVIVDDGSTDNTPEAVRSFDDPRIKYHRIEQNVGYCKALAESVSQCSDSSEILFLMGADDILAPGTLEKVNKIFEENQNVGAVTRPFYWFYEDLDRAVRTTGVYAKDEDVVVSVGDGPEAVAKVFDSLGQLSGLAYRREYIDLGFDFSEDIFTSHIYPFASIFKNHPVVFLKDHTVAVRIGTSQTIRISSVYERSPLQSWVDMFNTIFCEDKFREVREYCVKDFAAKNFLGLIQIKNYGRLRWLIREIGLLLKHNHLNIFDPRFWFFSLGSLIVPKSILVPLVRFYKERILSNSLRGIELRDLREV